MSTVAGLQSALSAYDSDKVKERDQGREAIREIFGNRENLEIFQESASRDGGSGWTALFQCLFQVVSREKKAVVKKGATAQAERRLNEAISLVRWITERSVHLISRKPFGVLFTHMTQLLVFSSSIFPPAALDYAKALRTLLSYPPHLASLDAESWKVLMGVCWAALLGDEVTIESEWQDGEEDDNEPGRRKDGGDSEAQAGPSTSRGRTSITQATAELVTLIPILLSSPSAPLISPLPADGLNYRPTSSLGFSVLLKICRFLGLHPIETSVHLPVLRSLNIVLEELEFNARLDLVDAGLKVFPQLVGLWGTRNKVLREQVLIAFTTLLPHLSHKSTIEKDKAGVLRDGLEHLVEYIPRETATRGGIHPIEFNSLRLRLREKDRLGPFETQAFSAGFDFHHEDAIGWATLALYADCCVALHRIAEAPSTATQSTENRPSKRRKVANGVDILSSAVTTGSTSSRVLALQVIALLLDTHMRELHGHMLAEIRDLLLTLLDDDEETLQGWAFIDLAILARYKLSLYVDELDHQLPMTPSFRRTRRKAEEDHWTRAWAHAVRKLVSPGTYRMAAITASAILTAGLVPQTVAMQDIGSFMRNLDVQGPPHPADSICHFLSSGLQLLRSDVGMYKKNLEEKLVEWVRKWDSLEGSRGKARMDVYVTSDLHRLLAVMTQLPLVPLPEVSTIKLLPDCAIVNRILEVSHTRRLREFILFGHFPSEQEEPSHKPSTRSVPAATLAPSSLAMLAGHPREISVILSRGLDAFVTDWTTPVQPKTSPPERIRRSLDMAVLFLSFQTSVQLGGFLPDSEGIYKSTQLMKIVAPYLASISTYNLAALHLIWSAFHPWVHVETHHPPIWPILLRPDLLSGVCKDTLHPDKFASAPTTQSYQMEELANFQAAVWNLPSVGEVLQSFFDVCLALLDTSNSSTALPPSQNGTRQVKIEDDDFGEIRVAESDAMPLSKEAVECQRTTASLLQILVSFRLGGTLLLSPIRQHPKDSLLLNAFLWAEGPRFVQLGRVLCDAVKDGLLRLTADAVDYVLDALEEMLASYAYSRDEGLAALAISWMTCSAPVWLAGGVEDGTIGEKAMHLIKFLAVKASKELLPWRARLAILLFIDEYLDFDPTFTAWMNTQNSQFDFDKLEAKWGPLAIVSTGLVDNDARVRFRAATTTAGLFYLPSFPVTYHVEFYRQVVAKLPSTTKHQDSFVTDLLFKLNSLVTSAHARPNAIFHLYEIPLSSSIFNTHIHLGLENVAKTLGLQGVSSIYLPYASLIMQSQLQQGQQPLRVPSTLYGFNSRRAFAEAVLPYTAPTLFAKQGPPDGTTHHSTLASLCESTDMTEKDVLHKYLASIVALSLTEDTTTFSNQVSRKPQLLSGLLGMPSWNPQDLPADLIQSQAELVTAELFALMSAGWEGGGDVEYLIKQCGGDGRLYTHLASNDTLPPPTVDALHPFLLPNAVFAAYKSLRKHYRSLSTSKTVFNGLLRLFEALNASFLASEQQRYVRSVAALIAMFPEELRSEPNLGLLLQETVLLLVNLDIGHAAFTLFRWGFEQIPQIRLSNRGPNGLQGGPSTPNPSARTQGGATQLPSDHPPVLEWLHDILVKLGQIWSVMSHRDDTASRQLSEMICSWVVNGSQSWLKVTNIAPALETTAVLWPNELANPLQGVLNPTFDDLCVLAEKSTGGSLSALCQRLAHNFVEGDALSNAAMFRSSAFWTLRQEGTLGQLDRQGSSAFIELLHRAGGHLHAPDLDVLQVIDGQARIPVLRAKLKDNPSTLLHAVVLEEVVRFTASTDYRLRTSANNALRSMKTLIDDVTRRRVLTENLIDYLAMLVPDVASISNTPGISLKSFADDDLWVQRSKHASEWSTALAIHLCRYLAQTDSFYAPFALLLRSAPSACTVSLRYLVHAMLVVNNGANQQELEQTSVTLSAYFTAILASTATSTETIETIIGIVLYLRDCLPSWRKDALGYTRWLDIDPCRLSEAAIRCGAYSTSLLFLELAVADGTQDKAINVDDVQVQKIMYEIYSNVEDPDGFYGIVFTDIREGLRKRLQHEGQHWRAFGLNSAMVEAGRGAAVLSAGGSAMRSLLSLGFDKTTSAMSRGITTAGTALDESILPELAWRTADWDLPLSRANATSSNGLLYSALRAVHRERSVETAREAVFASIKAELSTLHRLGPQRMTQMRAVTMNLLCLREIAVWLGDDLQLALKVNDSGSPCVRALTDLDELIEFKDAERIMATRQSLLLSARQAEERHLFGDLSNSHLDGISSLQKSCYIKLSAMARKDGNIQAAINAITAVQALQSSDEANDEIEAEFSQVLWAQGEHSLAIANEQQRSVKLSKENVKVDRRLAILRQRLADWQFDAKLTAPEDIQQLFENAIKMAPKTKFQLEAAQVAHSYARFADAQQATMSKDPEIDRLRALINGKPKDLLTQSTSSHSRGRNSTTRSVQTTSDQGLAEDVDSFDHFNKQIIRYTKIALRYYALALELSDEFDESMTRFVSLWLENDGDDEVNVDLKGPVTRIPSHKCIFLAPQLAARLDRSAPLSHFNTNLNTLVERASHEHPYHFLYTIITLAHSAVPAGKSRRDTSINEEGRGPAAAAILAALEAKDNQSTLSRAAVQQMRIFANAVRPWCLYQEEEGRSSKEYEVPTNMAVRSLKLLSIPVASRPPPVDVSLQYNDMPTFQRYSTRYGILGGIHKPKRMKVYDSFGKQHLELHKGEDDVRQDAVMEQVFSMSNRLLIRDRKSKQRELRFRTYVVIPFPEKTGVMEFVGDGMAIGDWLKAAHARYRSSSETLLDKFRPALASKQEKDQNSAEIVKTWETMMRNLRPVMRHFFTEKQKDPMAWFTMRLSYVRSVAVTSMVGFVLGIGDRHCSNILLDQKTGELVHIDFGVVFEDGRRLRIPERVPFRLTNDVVDGFGITGTEGTFKQCSQHTMRVLRDSSELIMTVLEVFKHDPLYAWSGDPEKLQRAQGGGRVDVQASSTAVEKADRVLSRIRQKLRQDLSVEYQVNQLIHEARSTEHLAKIFVGWQSWL